jgi:hypothetical protein
LVHQSVHCAANLAPARRAFYGLLPASISRSGYAARPMHSDWDDFWALKSYKEVAPIGTVLGHRQHTLARLYQTGRFRRRILWPGAQPAGPTRLDGTLVSWQGPELRIPQRPAEVIVGT